MYGLPFLTKHPAYECLSNTTGEWTTCTAEYICENDLSFGKDVRIDYKAKDSYHNWFDPSKLDLTCVSSKL